MMKLQLQKGICIGIPVEKNVPLMIAQVEDTLQLEENIELEEEDFDLSDKIKVKTKKKQLEIARNGLSLGSQALNNESGDTVMNAIRNEYKDFKHLCQAIEYETNPVVVSQKMGVNSLIEQRINSINEKEFVIGPITSKGKRVKLVDLSNSKSVSSHMSKVQTHIEKLKKNIKIEETYNDLDEVIEEVFGL